MAVIFFGAMSPTRPGFKIAGSILLVLLLGVAGYWWVTDYFENDALNRARASAEVAAETTRLEDALFRAQLKRIAQMRGPAAEAYWRAKEQELRKCKYADQKTETCKRLEAAFQKALPKP